MICVQCKNPASVLFRWIGSMGQQQCALCSACGQAWWNQYRNTAAGQTLQIAETKA